MDAEEDRENWMTDRQTYVHVYFFDNSPTREPCRVKDGLQLCLPVATYATLKENDGADEDSSMIHNIIFLHKTTTPTK
jgi:hypothetical protein